MNEQTNGPRPEPATKPPALALGFVAFIVIGVAASAWFNISGWIVLCAAFVAVALIYSMVRWPLGSVVVFLAVGWVFGRAITKTGRVWGLSDQDTNYVELTVPIALLVWAVVYVTRWIVVKALAASRAAPTVVDAEAASPGDADT